MEYNYVVMEISSDKDNCCIAKRNGELHFPDKIEDSMMVTYYTLVIVKKKGSEVEGIIAARDKSFNEIEGMLKIPNWFIRDYVRSNGDIGEISVNGNKIIKHGKEK